MNVPAADTRANAPAEVALPGAGVARPSPWRHPVAAYRASSTAAKWFWPLLAAYIVLTAAVLLETPVLAFDAWIREMRWKGHHENLYPYVHTYVILGQRGPATLVALPWFLWIARRRHSVQPLVMLVVALAVLNVSVGVVKILTGRDTPREPDASAYAIFTGGNIYPSGHISNCVVLYGLITMIAAAQYRRMLTVISAFITVTVSIGTVLINTHWVTDVVAGALAGGLVLCTLPWLVPPAERWWLRRWARWQDRRAIRTGRAQSAPGSATGPPGRTAADDDPAEELAS